MAHTLMHSPEAIKFKAIGIAGKSLALEIGADTQRVELFKERKLVSSPRVKALRGQRHI